MIPKPHPLAPINPEGLEQIAEALLNEETPPSPNPAAGIISLEDKTDYWNVQGVAYRNSIYTVDLAKTLLEDGTAKTQDQWSAYTKQAKASNAFHVADAPLYHALFTALCKNKDHPQQQAQVEEARAFLKKAWLEKWLMTLTRIVYTPSGKDKVLHNYGLAEQWSMQTTMVGPDEWVKNATDKQLYKVLLDTDNTTEIQAVYHWLTDRDAHLWRMNNAPERDTERVVRFFADADRAFLDCGRDPQGSNAAIGVRLSAAGAQKI